MSFKGRDSSIPRMRHTSLTSFGAIFDGALNMLHNHYTILCVAIADFVN